MGANMEVVYERACGIDVYKKEFVVCLILILGGAILMPQKC